jgi:hypothetical protein
MSDPIREQLASSLDWKEAHADLFSAVDGLDPALRGRRPPGLPHSIWELVEHIRIALHDVWDFTINPSYKYVLEFPAGYWPPTPEPPSDAAWNESLATIRRELDAFKAFVLDPSTDLSAKIPHGEGQTYVREALIVVDHNSYHIAQIVLTRRLLGVWNPS